MDDDFTAWLEAELRKPITVAESLGHTVESDPPAAITAAERWTCTKCGDAVLRYRDVIYGSASAKECTGATQ